MKQTLTTEEMIEYITLHERTPETVQRVAYVNSLLSRDGELRRRMAALEALYDSITLGPTEDRKAFLKQAAAREERLRERG